MNGITGKMYNVVKTMCSRPATCVNVVGSPSHWFLVQAGVRQGDSLSPILFEITINGLPHEVKSLPVGIDTGFCQISLLLYADDIVLLAPTENNAQKMWDVIISWCNKWGMNVNISKSDDVHIRNEQCPQNMHSCYWMDRWWTKFLTTSTYRLKNY